MNILEKAEKSLEFLKSSEGSAKRHDLQAAAGTLGRCLGALGSRANCARHYANLLHSAVPVLLSLASNDSAEVRLVGDEALNRAVAGGFAFHSYKTNIILQNQIDRNKNARWIRAALSRICLGDCWLRPGVGKIRTQAQTLFPKLSQIVHHTSEIQLIVEALESNLPRILNALAEYTTDEEMSELAKALLSHIDFAEASVRRGIATCIAHLCCHREQLLTNILGRMYEHLWPIASSDATIIGWFCVIKAMFQINEMNKFTDNDLFSVQDYLELYHLCIHYLEQTTTEHNVQNSIMECLSVILSKANGDQIKALLDLHPRLVCLESRQEKMHRRNLSTASAISIRTAPSPLTEPREPEITFSGALQLGSLLQLPTPSLSVEDLTIQTPDTPVSGSDMHIPDTEQLSKDLTEKLHEIEDDHCADGVNASHESVFKINIGTSSDDDVMLKYLARLLISKFLLTGNKGGVIPDRSMRVSVKSSALSCLSEILRMYPQVMTMYLDKDADMKLQNFSAISEGVEFGQGSNTDFILERNICYQDSITESGSQELSSKSIPQPCLQELAATISANMTCSNITTNSANTATTATTASNEPTTTGYPMTSSGGVSSSLDLDMRFDHFGDSQQLEQIEVKEIEVEVPRTKQEREVEHAENVEQKDFEVQHISDVFVLLECHSDPQIRGLVRMCIGAYLNSALEQCYGDYSRWKFYAGLVGDVADALAVDKLMEMVLKGLSDEVHSTVSQTLRCLARAAPSLLIAALPTLPSVSSNSYWLCRLELCRVYERMPYDRLFIICQNYYARCKQIMDTLIQLLADQDQKVRAAAAQAISIIIPKLNPSPTLSPTTMLVEMATNHTQALNLGPRSTTLGLVRSVYFQRDLPKYMRGAESEDRGSLASVVGDLIRKLLSSSCKFYSQGILEALQAICRRWSPWKYKDAFTDQGLLGYCLDSLDYCNGSVATRALLLDLCCMIYPVEIHKVMKTKSPSDIFERDQRTERWQHLEGQKVASSAEKFLQVTLKMLNVLVHLIEEVNPNVHLNKGGIVLPGSPVRRKTQDTIQKKGGNMPQEVDDKGSLKKKAPVPPTSLKANFAGHFFNEPFYMKLYENLRAMYSNHKINLDPKNSVFYDYLSTVLNCLSVQLELSTERELGQVTEEILYYLKVLMPLCPSLTVYCVTQLLKCLFGTNMLSQYSDYMSICDIKQPNLKPSFYKQVLLVNTIGMEDSGITNSFGAMEDSRSVSSLMVDDELAAERRLLIALENFSKNKSDRKWSTNKKELERYIRLFEPVVIQALKSYTMQNDIPLQCEVLALLNQLLALRVNYCMLDSDQIFIGFLMKQLDLVEQHEIPDCCELVNSILLFLVQLSSSKHHTKQLIEIPKLIQLCDGLMASGAHAECIAGLEPVAVRVFSNMGGGSTLGRAQQQEAQATREVLFYMLQKTMHQRKVLELAACVIHLSRTQPEGCTRWSELGCDTLLKLLASNSVVLEERGAIGALESFVTALCRDALLDQPRVEQLLGVLFQAPPEQATTPRKHKLRYLATIMVLLKRALTLLPESEILLSIDYLKGSRVSPRALFFRAPPSAQDPLNVRRLNDSCAGLSPDVLLARFLFRILTYAVQEAGGCRPRAEAIPQVEADGEADVEADMDSLMYAVCVGIVVQAKSILHFTDGCLFPLTAKTAQNLLHNEQSGLNTGLYSPEENIPLDELNAICLKSAHRLPLLIVHWTHLLIRLNFLSEKQWHRLPAGADDMLQLASVLAYCEYFVENGLTQAVHLSWLLVNRVHILISHYGEDIVKSLIARVQENSVASGLLLQAIAARCQGCLKGEFALNTYKVLSLCHGSQSGPLIFLICRIIGKLEPAVGIRFAKLAMDRCKMLVELADDKISSQLSKEDLQVAMESLQRDKVHIRYSSLVVQLNRLAGTCFDLSPLELTLDRVVNPQNVLTTNVDSGWLLNEVKIRCRANCSFTKSSHYNDLALVLANLPKEDLQTIMSCPEFERKILTSCFTVACDTFIKEFLNILSISETKEMEIEMARERELAREREGMTSSMDSNKLNMVNSLQVFKRSDSREAKSQFFIPMNDIEKGEGFGNLKLTEEEIELTVPEMPDLYQISVTALDKSIGDILRLFPKQNRPLSESENFNLNIEQTIDRYTRRCHQVFQDKLFYQEFMTIHSVLTGFLNCLDRTISTIDQADCDLLEKCIENIITANLCRSIAIFCVVSLQYLSFLIKNKEEVETPVNAEVSFRATNTEVENIIVDQVILVVVDNVAQALSFEEIWSQLNTESNSNRTQSAISCLYAVLKYLVKDTKPLVLKHHMPNQDSGPKSDFVLTSDKLITMVQYWEQNFYTQPADTILSKSLSGAIERLLVSMCRLEVVTNIALIPPLAWSYVEVTVKNDVIQKIDLPLQALQDMDVLESFLFRVNLIGWSSKKQFEEIWVGLLGALQGNGTHWAVKGIAQLLVTTAPKLRGRGMLHVPRRHLYVSEGMQRLRNLLVGTTAYRIFDDVNLERVPLYSEGSDGYHYAQFSTEYLKLASDMTDEASFKVRRAVKRKRKCKEIDVNSCLQLLMDVTTEMLEPKASTGLASRTALLSSISRACVTFGTAAQWGWAGAQLASQPPAHWPAATRALLHALAVCLPVLSGEAQELSTVHQKLLKSLTSSYAPLRQAALHGCLLQLSGRTRVTTALTPGPYQELIAQLNVAVRQYLLPHSKISLYEQSLYWTVLFTLVELGNPELITLAADFVLGNPKHYCAELVIRGITSVLRQQILPKDLKNGLIEKLLDNMGKYSEEHSILILMVHLFTADSRLLSPKLASDASNMDPDVLMNSMERITLLYKTLKRSKMPESKRILGAALKYFLRETLPPAAILSRVVLEFVECCKETEKRVGMLSDRRKWVQCSVLNARVVYEVFEAAVTQDQLAVLSGWIFEALCHLLTGKVSPRLLPYCALALVVAASERGSIRKAAPIACHALRSGFAIGGNYLMDGQRSDVIGGNCDAEDIVLDTSDVIGGECKGDEASSDAIGRNCKGGVACRIGGAMPFHDRRLLCVVSTQSGFTHSQLSRLKELCENNEGLGCLMQCLTAHLRGEIA